MIVVTTDEVPGYAISAVLGEVFGLTVRSLKFAAGLRIMQQALSPAAEIPELTSFLLQGRNEAMGRMLYEAHERGANAVVGMRFDTNHMMEQLAEVCVYGTAVRVEPVTEDARRQLAELAQTGGQMPHTQRYRASVP
jgi:uncharacterized protein YbjQ (UPF0145 family)